MTAPSDAGAHRLRLIASRNVVERNPAAYLARRNGDLAVQFAHPATAARVGYLTLTTALPEFTSRYRLVVRGLAAGRRPSALTCRHLLRLAASRETGWERGYDRVADDLNASGRSWRLPGFC